MILPEYRKRVESVMLAKIPRREGELLLPWRHVASREESGAFELVYRVPIGMSALELERQIDALYAACGAPVVLEDYAGAVLLRVLPEDFPQVVPYQEELLTIGGKRDIVVGLDRQGVPLVHSLRVPHLMIAGKSGYGKTDLIRWVLFQLIAKNSPEEIDIWIIDLKGFSFLPFKHVPHVSRIVRDLPGANALLSEAVKIMEERSRLVWDSGDRGKAQSFKTLFVLIDEAYMIAPKITTSKTRKELAKVCDEAAATISGTGREAGVGLIYCTQRPDSDVINPLVKANMDCKICFKTETESNSIVVLDRPGAENLPHKKPGRVLYASDGLKELQVPYIGGDSAWSDILRRYEDESKGRDFDACAGDTLFLDGTGGEVFQGQWEPVQTGKRDAQELGAGGALGGQAPGDRQGKIVETLLDWSQIFKGR